MVTVSVSLDIAWKKIYVLGLEKKVLALAS